DGQRLEAGKRQHQARPDHARAPHCDPQRAKTSPRQLYFLQLHAARLCNLSAWTQMKSSASSSGSKSRSTSFATKISTYLPSPSSSQLRGARAIATPRTTLAVEHT